ncbi:hypothetical protein [Mannheimia indoligenes]|uniref:hypothetical protein n=1 Tax=Mannheimia indoligenes TaxID=3103145 RepID=UPI002FE5ABD6
MHIFTKVDSNGDGKIDSTVRYVRTDSDAIGFIEIINPYINETDQRTTSIDFHDTTNHHEDFTTSEWATRLETVGGRLNRIHFLYDNTVDSLTIDSQTIANFVNSTTKRLNITGNEHKTVHFTDFTEANQLSETRYQFNFDGNTYTVNVDEAVNVVLG